MERPIFVVALLAIITATINIFIGPELNVLVFLASFLILLALKKYKKVSYLYLLILLIIPIVIIRCNFYKRQASMIADLEPKEELCANVSGYVNNIEETDNGISFRIYDASVLVAEEKDEFSLLVYADSSIDLSEADYIEAMGKLKRLNTARNEGNFNQEKYYESLGIKGVFTIEKLDKKDQSRKGIYPELFRLKRDLLETYDKIFTKEKASIIKAMTLGFRNDLTKEQKLDFKDSGIAHLLSISALHVSLLGLTIYKLLKRRFDLLLAGIFAAFIMLSYLIITNNGISCRRAVIMLLAYILADNLARTNDLITSISLGLVILIIDNPFVITNTGFLLSFLSMAGIAFIYPIVINDEYILVIFKREKLNKKDIKQAIKRKILEAFLLSLSIQIATLPIILLMNYEFAVISCLLNLIVIPLFSLLMVTAFISGLVGLFSINLGLFFAGTSNYILDFYAFLIKIFTSFKGAIILTGAPKRSICIAYYLILVLLIVLAKLIRDEIAYFLLAHFKRAFVVLIVGLIIVASNLHFKENKGLNLISVDVGQGDCQLITIKGRNFLIDAGSTDVKNVGEYRLFPLLKYRKIDSLEAISISHFDSDHVNAIIEILENYPRINIKEIAIPDVKNLEENDNFKRIVNLADKRGVKINYIKAGDILFFNKELDLKITCLHPVKDYDYTDANEYSTSHLIEYGDFKELTIGDATKRAELDILENAKKLNVDLKNIDILKVGHHGSKTSSDVDFINYTRPSLSIISCGVKNRYHHPNKETIDKLNAINSKIFITSKQGEIIINIDNKGNLKVRSYLD